jgi:hypothetical protein
MLHLQKRTYAILLIVLLVVGGALFVLLGLLKKPAPIPVPPEPVTQTPTSTAQLPWHTMTVIGASVEGRPIEAHTFGNGSTSLLFVGGIHGGYEWNSVLLAYEVMDYLATYPETVPSDLTIHVIPSLNPDGLSKVVSTTGRFTLADVPTPSERVAAARFNANNVDLNRNFDCKWQPTSTWQGKSVSAGAAVFSEPEAIALRDYVLKNRPTSRLVLA